MMMFEALMLEFMLNMISYDFDQTLCFTLIFLG